MATNTFQQSCDTDYKSSVEREIESCLLRESAANNTTLGSQRGERGPQMGPRAGSRFCPKRCPGVPPAARESRRQWSFCPRVFIVLDNCCRDMVIIRRDNIDKRHLQPAGPECLCEATKVGPRRPPEPRIAAPLRPRAMDDDSVSQSKTNGTLGTRDRATPKEKVRQPSTTLSTNPYPS